MKKWIFVCAFTTLFVHGFSQNSGGCIGTTDVPFPYAFDFGTVGDTSAETELWKYDYLTSGMYFWYFGNTEGDNVLHPAYKSTLVEPPVRTLYSRCVHFENTKKYHLKFSFVGQTVGALCRLKIFLANPNQSEYYNDETFFIDSINNLPLGTTECLVMFDTFPAPSGDYRIAIQAFTNTQAGFYLKDMVLEELPQHELTLVRHNSPLSRCDLNSQSVSFKVKNTGTVCPAFNLCYQYNTGEGTPYGAPVCHTFNEDIPYGTIKDIYFPAPQTFNADVNMLKAWVSYSGQTNVPDTLRTVIERTVPHNVPYTCSFDNFSIFKDWVIVPKITQPDRTWEVPLGNDGNLGGEAKIITNGIASDDRLVSGCIELQKDTLYQISFTYSAHSSYAYERLSCYVGLSNAPQASDFTLMDIRDFNSTTARTITTYFKPNVSGSHFFGFLAYSNFTSAGITVSDFSLKKAERPASVPVYMGFENYDNGDYWQTFNYNQNTNNWHENDDAFAGSSHAIFTTSATSNWDRNDNWLISKPVLLEKDKTYEVLYFRKNKMVREELLNVYVTDNLNFQSIKSSEPTLRDTINTTSFSVEQGKRVYFKAPATSVYFVLFQYHSASSSGIEYGISLDEIAIRDSAIAADTNVDMIDLTLPSTFIPCELRTEKITMMIKNRSAYSLSSPQIRLYLRMNSTLYPGNGYNLQLDPYELRTITSNNLPMTSSSTYKVQAWIGGTSDSDPTNDTSAVVQAMKIKPFAGIYTMDFESGENTGIWKNSQTGGIPDYWWTFKEDQTLAHKGKRVAYLPPTAVLSTALSQYIATPCLSLSKDTTYFISFYYRAADLTNARTSTKLNVYAGSENVNYIEQRKDSTIVNNLNYKQFTLHYRPAVTGTQYIVIEGISDGQAGGVCIDDFKIIDSARAHAPSLSMKRVYVSSQSKCDLSSDTIYVEIQNDGTSDFTNPDVKVNFGYQTISESLTGTVPTGQTRVFKLHTRFTHTRWGTDSVRAWLNIPLNVPMNPDTSAFVKSAKYQPVSEFPYEIAFADTEIQGWNNLPESYTLKTPFEYWKIGNGSNHAVFENGTNIVAPGYLTTNCLDLKADSVYLITYQYRTESALNNQNLRVLHDHADGITDTLVQNLNFNNTSYLIDSAIFKAIGNGFEKIFLVNNYTVQSNKVYVNKFSIAAYVPPDSITSIQPVLNEALVNIYPNPAETDLHIKAEREISTISVYDMLGVLQGKFKVKNTEYQLNTGLFLAGTYLFVIQIGDARIARRVVIKNQNP